MCLPPYAAVALASGSVEDGRWSAADEEAMRNDDSRTAPCSILVVDDMMDAVDCLAMLLQLDGHRVYTATSGMEALELGERQRPDAALIDISMPVMDGYELARRIRAQPWGEAMLLVALTGWDPDSRANRLAEAGFDAHVIKPVDMDRLKEVLGRATALVAQRAQAKQSPGNSAPLPLLK
jgi:two-component system CheB/CheR fusion protein